MSCLYLLRHAHAGDPMKWHDDDSLRPLSEKGRRQAERLGRLLGRAEGAPDRVVTSPLVRAEQTARIVAEALGVELVVDRRLAGPLDPALVADIVLAAGPAERPCIVGHDPDFSELLGELTGTSPIPMRKGTLARIDFGGGIATGRGTIGLLIPADVLAGL